MPQLLFALLFFVCRLCVGPLVVAATLRSPTTPLVVKAGGAGILLVSLVWFRKVRGLGALRRLLADWWQIVAVARHKARKQAAAQKAGKKAS